MKALPLAATTLLLPLVLASRGADNQQNSELPHSSDWLSLLPEGESKRKFILDCTGCHQFDSQVLRPGGAPRAVGDWKVATSRMLGFAGATTGFPVIAHDRNADSTAEWLARYVSSTPMVASRPALPAGARIVEYDLPLPQDLAHDVAIDSAGSIVVTGMFSHTMYTLDTASKGFQAIPIPWPGNSNPRAVDIDAKGNWWVVLGAPNAVARYNPATLKWDTWRVGLYAHSVAIDADDNAWVNGHFTRDPIQMVRIDGATAALRSVDLPRHPVMSDVAGGPIPYEIRAAPDGVIWMSELGGNRLISHDPASGQSRAYDMPMSHMGPRRFDIDRNGILWIPAYSANELVRLDPSNGSFTRFVLPIGSSLPYVVRIDQARGTVWVGSGSADVVFAFDPRTTSFTTYPLPSRGAMVRHLTVDPRTHELWIAYGASPGRIPSRIARLTP